MRYLKHIIIFSLLAALALISGCSGASRSFSRGEQLESEGKFEEAMYSYADAFMKDPETGVYRVHFFSAREKAASRRFKAGSDQFAKGDYAGALEHFQAGLGIDPSQARFKQQADISARLKEAQHAYREGLEFEKGNKYKDADLAYARAVELHSDNKEYQAALTRIAALRKSKLEGYELNLKSTKPITLKFKDAKLKDVFNIVTQLSGINFAFDEGIKDTPITIYVENATFHQVVDLLVTMNKLGKKILNETTVIIYPSSPDKKKQYEDMQLRTFHLNYMDAKKAVNLIRTMIQVRKIYVNEESNSVVVRDTNDVVEVVEKLLDANDVADPEVVLDVEVIEVSDTQSQNLGLLLSDYSVKFGAFSPNNNLLSSNSLSSTTSAVAAGSTSTTNPVTIDNLIQAFTLKGYSGFVTVPNATYNLGKTLAKGEVLSNPKIRVKNKEKSKFNVGQRVPITTTTLNGTVSQVNVQYVDVGVKVNAEPNIQLNNDIVIKLSLEVSSILTKEKVGGTDSLTTVVTIGTRNLETVLSLRDGETSIIGGLISNTRSDSKQKVVVLGDLPLLGPLLSNNVASKDKTELILAITPRLVRGVTVPQNSLMSFSSGKEDDPSLLRPLASFDQEPVYDSVSQPKGSEKKPIIPVTPVMPIAPTASTTPGTPAATVPKAATPGLAAPPAAVPAVIPPVPPALPAKTLPNSAVSAEPVTPAAPAAQAPKTAQRSLLQIAAPSSVTAGQQFSVDIKVNGVADLLNASFILAYDPALVEFLSMTEGTFMKKDGTSTTFNSKAETSGGAVAVSLARKAGSSGVSGDGSLATVLFKPKKQGSAGFAFRNVGFSGVKGAALTILPFSTAVDIR
ncbi:MAG: cohesin domain-containing protein [Desulfuromonadales bacterium]